MMPLMLFFTIAIILLAFAYAFMPAQCCCLITSSPLFAAFQPGFDIDSPPMRRFSRFDIDLLSLLPRRCLR
jgi:hypothetical protein